MAEVDLSEESFTPIESSMGEDDIIQIVAMH